MGEVAPRLAWLDPELSAAEARKALVQGGFTLAPVRGDPPGVVTAADLQAADSIAAATRRLDPAAGIDARLGLSAAIGELKDRAHLVVFEGPDPVALWSRADLQLPAVSLLAFAFGLAAEAGLSRIILDVHGEEWIERLSPGAREKVERIWEDKRRDGVELSRLECAYLSDRLNLCERSEEIRERLGYPNRREFEKWSSQLIDLRNDLAHGGNLLRIEPDPSAAVGLFMQLRTFAERAWA